MIRDIDAMYRAAWAFARACPILFLVPVVVEFAQHVVELQLGMYDGEAGAKAAEANALRLQFGFAKTLALLLPGYWFTRYVMLGAYARRAWRPEWPAIGLWAVIFSLSAAQIGWGLFGSSLAELSGLEGRPRQAVSVAFGVAMQILAIYLAAWLVAWPLGNARLGPLRSIRVMQGSFWHALALMVAGVVPLMVLHYALAIMAVVWTPPWGDWLLMAADSLVVGLLALTMTGATVFAASRAAARKGIDLVPRAAAMGEARPSG